MSNGVEEYYFLDLFALLIPNEEGGEGYCHPKGGSYAIFLPLGTEHF
jgi:hypothetical protein